jgi:hypothetical protein
VIDARTGAVLGMGQISVARTKPMQFTVGLKLKGKTNHTTVEAEDALMAALKVKTRHPEARLTYVRPQNKRGDARHPAHRLNEDHA